MKTKIYTAFTMVIFLSMILFSCKSVNKLYQQGDYDEAVLTAVKKLKKNKLKEETKELAADAYAKAINWHKDNLLHLMVRTDKVQWDPIDAIYGKILQLNDAIYRSEEALLYVKPVNAEKLLAEAFNRAIEIRKENVQTHLTGNNELKWEAIENEYRNMQFMVNQVNLMERVLPFAQTHDFRQARADAAEQAAQVRIGRGNRFMQYNDKQNARRAYGEFSVAGRYRTGNTELEELRNRAYDAAATYVVINPVASRYYGYNQAAGNMERDLLNYLQHNSPSHFVKYYSAAQAEHLSRRPDQVLEVTLNDIRQGNAQTDRTEREVYKDNVLLREIRIRPDSVVKEYGRVSGRITTTRETINTTADAYITVRDAAAGQILMDRRVEGNYCFVNEYSQFRGDERALTDSDRNLVNRQRSNRPSEWELLNRLSSDLHDQVTRELRYFYSRY
jgi:cation transport regulator ChaB